MFTFQSSFLLIQKDSKGVNESYSLNLQDFKLLIRFFTQEVEKLAVDHRYQEVERRVRIRHDEEQRSLFIPQGVKLQFIVSRDLPKFLYIKRSQPCSAAHKYRLGCFA